MTITELIDQLTALAPSVGTSAVIYVETEVGDRAIAAVEHSHYPIGARLILGGNVDHLA